MYIVLTYFKVFLCELNNLQIILCDECNNGFHMTCLSPPLMDVPEEDWYCPSCRRNPNDVIAPGAAKQMKKASAKSKRDWGRGMACVGKLLFYKHSSHTIRIDLI